MLVVSRFTVPPAEGDRFAELATAALAALADRPGFRRGHAGRAVDDPAEWVLVSEWDGVGAYRRALGTYEVKLAATPLLAQARADDGAFEELVSADRTGIVATATSDRAADADTAGPRGPAGLDPETAGGRDLDTAGGRDLDTAGGRDLDTAGGRDPDSAGRDPDAGGAGSGPGGGGPGTGMSGYPLGAGESPR